MRLVQLLALVTGVCTAALGVLGGSVTSAAQVDPRVGASTAAGRDRP